MKTATLDQMTKDLAQRTAIAERRAAELTPRQWDEIADSFHKHEGQDPLFSEVVHHIAANQIKL